MRASPPTQMSTLEQEGEEVVGQARCPFESRQSNVGLFAGEPEVCDVTKGQVPACVLFSTQRLAAQHRDATAPHSSTLLSRMGFFVSFYSVSFLYNMVIKENEAQYRSNKWLNGEK